MTIKILGLAAGITACLWLSACNSKVDARVNEPEAPQVLVEHVSNNGTIRVAHPEQFPLVAASEHVSTPELNVTGSVTPDITRNIPVISLASGRVVEIQARIGDTVSKGQLLMRVQSSDIAQAFSDHRQALADEKLANAQLNRSKLLYERGAIAQKDLEVAIDAHEKAQVTVETTLERLKVLGADANQPSALVNIYAPASGVITEQNVTAAAGVKTLDNSPNLFTIADISRVWIICDVYENQLPMVHVGEYADIRVDAYPNRVFRGRIANIGPVLDQTIRTAKVRIELANPGMLRFGMFVNATFHGVDWRRNASVPATAVLHLHDRDWVYVPAEPRTFQRVEVIAGEMLPGHMQEIVSGITPGQQVVARALIFQNAAEQ
jgi:cobalt-zinc-cadmium efflux system membrane fusion protein